MAQQDFSLGSYGTGHLSVNENWNSSTQVSYHIRLWATTGGGYHSASGGSWNGNAGGIGGSGAFNYSGNGDWNLWEFDYTYNKDANGNGSWNFYGYINGDIPGAVGAGSTSFNMSPGRIGIAPPLTSVISDSIKPTSARIGAEIGGYGLGTSAAFEAFYRVQGASGWNSLGVQGDVGGYNFWNLSGLQAGRTYEYYVHVYNNNGDAADSGVQTFKTQPVSGMITVMQGLL